MSLLIIPLERAAMGCFSLSRKASSAALRQETICGGPDEGIPRGGVPALSQKATPNLLTEHRIGGKLRGARVRRTTRWWYAI